MKSFAIRILCLTRAIAPVFVLFAFLILGFTTESNAAKEVTPIPVPKNVIFPGQVITDALLKDRLVPVDYLNRVSVHVDRSQTVGMVARTTLMPNQPIFTNSVVEPDVVKVNRPTIMEYVSGTLRITAEVMPLASAKKGEFVKARNVHSGSIVTGIAMGNGMIQARALR